MPTYEYRCPQGHEFDLFQRMSDDPRAPCPTCGAEAVRMLSSGAGFLFKGGGFYITDYRSDDYRKAVQSEKGGGDGSGDSAKGVEGGAGRDAPASAPVTPSGSGASSSEAPSPGTPSSKSSKSTKSSPAPSGGDSGPS